MSLQNSGGEQQTLTCLPTSQKWASNCYMHKLYLYESVKYD